eukprot:gene4168-27862_t
MASAAPSFLAAHQEGGTVQRLAAGMRDDDGEYKAVEELAGIGAKCGEVLRGKGYTSAYNVLGQYLVFNMDAEMFTDWLEDATDGLAKKNH